MEQDAAGRITKWDDTGRAKSEVDAISLSLHDNAPRRTYISCRWFIIQLTNLSKMVNNDQTCCCDLRTFITTVAVHNYISMLRWRHRRPLPALLRMQKHVKDIQTRGFMQDARSELQ